MGGIRKLWSEGSWCALWVREGGEGGKAAGFEVVMCCFGMGRREIVPSSAV